MVFFHKLHSFIVFCILCLIILPFSWFSACKFIYLVVPHLGCLSLLFYIIPFCPPFCFHLFHICCTRCFASVILWSLFKTEIGQLAFCWLHSLFLLQQKAQKEYWLAEVLLLCCHNNFDFESPRISEEQFLICASSKLNFSEFIMEKWGFFSVYFYWRAILIIRLKCGLCKW